MTLYDLHVVMNTLNSVNIYIYTKTDGWNVRPEQL